MKTLDEKRVQRRRTERRQHKEDAKVLVPRWFMLTTIIKRYDVLLKT